MKDNKLFYCNECKNAKSFCYFNDLEKEELKQEGSFICSDCINKEIENADNLKDNNKYPYGEVA